MAKRETVADETIISALLSSPTLETAAKQCGLSVRQLYDRRKKPEFVRQLHEAQSAAMSGTVRYLQANTATAAETLVDICQNGQQEQTRLTAARTLLEQAARLTEVVDVMARLDRLEGIDDD